MSHIRQHQLDADVQLDTWDAEVEGRRELEREEVTEFMDVLRQRVHYEATADLVRIYCTLKADPVRGNRVTCCIFKVPRSVPFRVLTALLQRRFKQELLFTFYQPAGNGREERLLTPFNVDVLREVGHLYAPLNAPKPCHLPTYFLKARPTKLNPTLPSPFLPPPVKGAPPPVPRSPPRARSPIHDRLFAEAVEVQQRRDSQRRAMDDAVRQAAPRRILTPTEEAQLVRRMHDEQLQALAEAAAQERRQEEEALRQRLLLMSNADTADQVQRFFVEGVQKKEEEAKRLEKEWAPKPKPKAHSEADLQAISSRLYATAAENHKEVLRQQLYDELYRPHEVPAGPKMSPGELESTFQRLYKS